MIMMNKSAGQEFVPAAAAASTSTSSNVKDDKQTSIDDRSLSATQSASIRMQANSSKTTAHQQQTSSMSINKQHLSARAKTIIVFYDENNFSPKPKQGKLIESHGAELRRTLFSLRQIFQDDSELVNEFIGLDGLECLMKVASDADQIHQNYILRALGQLIVYQSGMNGLMRHNETIRWLYTLLASQHRLVVKTSIKLLLLFVEHSDNNCLHFCRAIKATDEAKGAILWSNILGLFKSSANSSGNAREEQQQQLQDVTLLVDAMTLINKTLAGIPDQNTFYYFVDPLEESGIEELAQKYSSIDAQMKKQFDIYEQVLRIEDENSSSSSTSPASSSTSPQVATSDSTRSSNCHPQDNKNFQDFTPRRRFKRAEPLNHVPENSESQQKQQVNKNEDLTTENSSINDDNYESANDESNSSQRQQPQQQVASASKPITVSADVVDESKRQVRAPVIVSKQKTSSSSNSSSSSCSNSIIKQNNSNLARGRQQRASISSCSSSDSYASYGSGYASGSGNSTDHELKQRSINNNGNIIVNNNMINGHTKEENQTADNKSRDDVVSRGAALAAAAAANESEVEVDDEDEDDDAEEEEEDDGDDSQLKKHLSELEQLTDELASSKIFGTLTQPAATQTIHQHRHHNFSSTTLKSTSSNSSSILSTGSNASSLLSSASSSIATVNDTQVQSTHLSTSSANTNESRSTSATPTSTIQPTTQTSSYAPACLNKTHPRNNEEMAIQVELDIPSQQYAAPLKFPPKFTSSVSQQQEQQQQQHKQTQQATVAQGSSSSGNKQEPYYHNLFQWEQLVSKGVTRPLLINDLDFTDLRDEDDCDLLNANGSNINGKVLVNRNHVTDEPLTINIPAAQQNIQGSLNLIDEQDSIDGAGTAGSFKSRNLSVTGTPASAPPPMPPPPISPWFNTISGSSGYSQSNQFVSSPSPPYDYGGNSNGNNHSSSGEFCRDQSPANSTYSNYSRNSVCIPQTSTPTRDSSILQQQYNTLQPITSLRSASSMSSLLFGNNGGKYMNKRKKTMKLFWKEVREDRSLLAKLTKKRTIWDEIKPIQIDTQKLEVLFESKAKDLLLSKSRIGLDSLGQRKVKITVLDAKRSNAINIGMTKLPPMRTIKSAILKMDSSIMNREGIEKILSTMMPSEEEKSRIIEAQLANPDTPLGTAEQFLLNLASISALEARLKLWAFQLDYAQIEKEVAEPLMDLKQAIDEIERSETFRIILGTLLAIGNFLNSTNAKGFQIDYLEKVPEVKDTVHKHSLLHHLCLFIQEKCDPQSTSDLYSEFGAVNRASKVDYAEVAKNLKKMQQDCKSSWDYLKIVAKHDGLANLMNTCSSLNSTSNDNSNSSPSSSAIQQPKSSGKLNNLSKLSMITTVMSTDNSGSLSSGETSQNQPQQNGKQLKTRVSDFLTDCAERIMVLMVIHRRVMNRFQKLLVYLGCPSHQIKQTQPQQILKIINEFALEYRTKRERVREMLAKKQQCQHHNRQHHLTNRWQMNRSRWAGSQQCMDTLGYNNRPCSTTSSCASSYAPNSTCNDSMCNISLAGDHRHQANQMQHNGNRACSPSGFSQISNYSDYLFDQSYCNSRHQSVTPVPAGEKGPFNQRSPHLSHLQQQHLTRRPHSMSVSMLDLQNQQQNCHQSNTVGGNYTTKELMSSNLPSNSNLQDEEVEQQIQKDAQLRRILGAGKSMDGTCSDLYQMSHWSSTMARVPRHQSVGYSKQRAASMDSSAKDDEIDASSFKQQSSYYRYLPGQCSIDDETEQNSDDEILQSLVRAATAKSTYSSQNGGNSSDRLRNGCSATTNNKSAKNKILSRFSCDRKSLRRTLRGGIELSNVS